MRMSQSTCALNVELMPPPGAKCRFPIFVGNAKPWNHAGLLNILAESYLAPEQPDDALVYHRPAPVNTMVLSEVRPLVAATIALPPAAVYGDKPVGSLKPPDKSRLVQQTEIR